MVEIDYDGQKGQGWVKRRYIFGGIGVISLPFQTFGIWTP